MVPKGIVIELKKSEDKNSAWSNILKIFNIKNIIYFFWVVNFLFSHACVPQLDRFGNSD